MIIDRVPIAGIEAYFQNPGNAGQVNLGGPNPLTARTKALGKGKQLEVSAIELLIDSSINLIDLFNFQPGPLFSITVMKEMFPALFADPFRHRSHSISGYEDFKRGTFENARAMDIDGIPTIVSVGTGITKWTSLLYEMPELVRLNHAAWELAASRKTPKENFKYSLKLSVFDANQTLVQTVDLANGLDPTQPRKVENLNLQGIGFYQVAFTADVKKDASIYEKHTTLVGESIGTPLLRAVNLLEPVESIYDIRSLQELLSLSSEYHLFESQGQALHKMLVTLVLSATLVQSGNEAVQSSKFEFVEIAVKSNKFSNFEGKLTGEVLMRPDVS
jgi:hypothetical protein